MQYVLPMLNTILWLVLSGIILVAGLWAYIKITPYNELELIRKGNVAAAVSLSGALLGILVTLAIVIAHTEKISHLFLWGTFALIVQLVVYWVVGRLQGQLRDQMEAGNVASGILLGAASLGGGILNAACLIPIT